MRVFPDISTIPRVLLRDPGACGPLAVWQVLSYFGIPTTPEAICAASRYDVDAGAHTVGLAVALAMGGCAVRYYSDADPNPEPVERILYKELDAIGVATEVPPDLAELLSCLDGDHVAVVLYQSQPESAFGHFTPVLGVSNSGVIAPNENEQLSISHLDELWRAPGLYRQALIACRAPAA